MSSRTAPYLYVNPAYEYDVPVPPFWSRRGWSILGHCLLSLPMGLCSPWVPFWVFGVREWETRRNGVPLWHKVLEVVAPTLTGYLVSLWV